MGAGSSSKRTPTILRGFRPELEPKEISITENASPKRGSPGLEMEEASDGETVVVTKKNDNVHADIVNENAKQNQMQEEPFEDSKDFVKTIDASASSGAPLRCYAKFNKLAVVQVFF